MSLFVKICGVTTKEAARAAVDAGANAVGFVFHAASPRNISPELARALAAGMPAALLKVAVTLHPSQEAVRAVLAAFTPDAWQSDEADLAALRLPAGVERWPVLRSGSGAPTRIPRRFVFEGARSGAGDLADWRAAARLAGRGELILGGGLNPGNVAAAVRAVAPFGVDVSSGVESAPGRKDPALIAAFVAAARNAAGVVDEA